MPRVSMVVRFAGLTWEVLIAWRGTAPDATPVPIRTPTMSTDMAAAAAVRRIHPASSCPSQPARLMHWTLCTMPRNRPPPQVHIEGAPQSASIELDGLVQARPVALADGCRLLGSLPSESHAGPSHPDRPSSDGRGPRPSPVSECSGDRKSTCLNSSHLGISYAVFCLKKK